jgi:hypothetical protein
MSTQDVKMVTVRMPLQLYNQVKNDADSRNASISDVVREAVVRRYEEPVPDDDNYIQPVKDLCEALTKQLQTKDQQLHIQLEKQEQQLGTKDEQIQQLHQLLAMKEKSVEEALTQLNRAYLQIEQMRPPRTIWQKLKATFASEAS